MDAAPLIDRLCSKLAEGVEAGLSPNGVLQILDSPSGNIHVVVDDGNIRPLEGLHEEPDVELLFRPAIFERWTSGFLDVRDPALIAELDVRGDLAFLHELATACARPDSVTNRTFQIAGDKARHSRMDSVVRWGRPASKEDVLAQLHAGLPTVFSGLLSSWPTVSFSQLREEFGHCTFRPGPDGGEPLAAFVDGILRGEDTYSHGCRVPDAMADLFRIPLFSEAEIGPRQIWMGRRSSRLVTRLHREAMSPFLAQVIGTKRLLLYSPDQGDLVYGRKAYRSFQQCWVDPDEPDFTRFPRFAEARALVVDLVPGEILLIPPAWYHCAYAVDDVLSISTVIKSKIL